MDLDEQSKVEEVTKSDILGLDTWNQERTSEQLLDFISRHEAAVASAEQIAGETA